MQPLAQIPLRLEHADQFLHIGEILEPVGVGDA